MKKLGLLDQMAKAIMDVKKEEEDRLRMRLLQFKRSHDQTDNHDPDERHIKRRKIQLNDISTQTTATYSEALTTTDNYFHIFNDEYEESSSTDTMQSFNDDSDQESLILIE